MDLASIIASALSSNLYLNGLAYLDYLNLPANMKPFCGEFCPMQNSSEADHMSSELLLANNNELSRKV